MIGNDIVDLKQAAKDSNWQRPRFLDKVFTKKEQQLIFSSKEQHQMVWLLWSMKEAAYKVNVQQFEKRFFNPKKLECELIFLEKGIVLIDDETYFTTSIINEDYVYTVANINNISRFKSMRFKIENTKYKTQSTSAKKELKKVFNIEGLQIKKNHVGVPKLFKEFDELKHSISMTHHGNYCGWTFI